MKNPNHHPIIIFDGICNLCNHSVNYIIKRDEHRKFKFTPLQSDAARKILLQENIANFNTNSIALIYNNAYYIKSSAVIKIFSILGGIYKPLNIMKVIPRWIRDSMYDIIAKKRYKWFGKQSSCMIPTNEIKDRFIEFE